MHMFANDNIGNMAAPQSATKTPLIVTYQWVRGVLALPQVTQEVTHPWLY